MFPYAGSKFHLAHLYPKPKSQRIIEPFAGSAGYSMIHFDRDVILIEKNEIVFRIWRWLQQCSKADILGLPRMRFRERVEQYRFDCKEAEWLMGFLISSFQSSPRKQVTDVVNNRPGKIEFHLQSIAADLFKIKHWNIMHGDFSLAKNIEATWFVDPPYQIRGKDMYGKNTIDYGFLAEWCKGRRGQVIACDSIEADWLPFKKMKRKGGKLGRGFITEAIWSNLPTDYDVEQLSLFGKEEK